MEAVCWERQRLVKILLGRCVFYLLATRSCRAVIRSPVRFVLAFFGGRADSRTHRTKDFHGNNVVTFYFLFFRVLSSFYDEGVLFYLDLVVNLHFTIIELYHVIFCYVVGRRGHKSHVLYFAYGLRNGFMTHAGACRGWTCTLF